MYDNNRLVEAAATSPIALGIKSPRSPKVLEALARVDRKDFLSDELTPLNIVQEYMLINLTGVMKEIKDLVDKPQSQLILSAPEGLPPHLILHAKLMREVLHLLNGVKELEVPASSLAYNNCTLPIGYDQTCSAPSMIALMNDLLELREGHRVLEIGTGCGYHAAITDELIGRNGNLTTLERIPELAETAKRNLAKYTKLSRIEVICGDGSKGHPAKAPYDRIYLTASVNPESFDPNPFMNQINKNDGIFLFPISRGGDFGPLSIWTFRHGNLDRKRVGNFYFVEMQGENQ